MFKNLKFVLIILLSNNVYSQSKEAIYVILDNESFYEITKKENSATLKIPYYAYRENWDKEKPKKNNNDNDEIVVVNTIPNKKYYTFYSTKKPIKKSNIDEISTFSVLDVSKENKKVWKKYPYKIIFIEKLSCESYILWHMIPEFQE